MLKPIFDDEQTSSTSSWSGPPIYVLDTNVIVDYPNIIPCVNGGISMDEPTIDLTGAHLVIPTAVVRELSSFKKEHSDRGKAARIVLKRLRQLTEDNPITFGLDENDAPIYKTYNLDAPIRVEDKLISLLPVHKNFHKSLPFDPSTTDMDGQVILATLSVIYRMSNIAIDGSVKLDNFSDLLPGVVERVILLTNDNGLAIRANTRGIRTSRFGYKSPPPYTGRRDIIVPDSLLETFINTGTITLDEWNEAMPDAPRLVANEFVIMSPESGEYPDSYDRDRWNHVGRFDVKEQQIVSLRYIFAYPGRIQNEGQAIYAEAVMDPDIPLVICTGPAGSGKTYMSTIAGYAGCKNGQYIGVTVIPCYVDRSELGALPGDLDEKLDPDVAPIKNALRNFLMRNDETIVKRLNNHGKFGDTDLPTREEKELARKSSKHEDCERDSNQQCKKSIRAKLSDMVDMIWSNWFENIYIANARGLSFFHEFVIYDEFQDQTRSQADTLLKRIGEHGKMIIAGDIAQIHAPYNDSYNNGLVYAAELVKDDYQVARVHFIESDVVRHRLVRLIAERQAGLRT